MWSLRGVRPFVVAGVENCVLRPGVPRGAGDRADCGARAEPALRDVSSPARGAGKSHERRAHRAGDRGQGHSCADPSNAALSPTLGTAFGTTFSAALSPTLCAALRAALRAALCATLCAALCAALCATLCAAFCAALCASEGPRRRKRPRMRKRPRRRKRQRLTAPG